MHGLDIQFRPVEGSQTIWDVYNSSFVPKHHPVICIVNGEPLLRKDWGNLVNADCQPMFCVCPRGGQGGAKGIIRMVALLAIAIAAPYAAPLLGAAIGVTSAIGIAAITAGITAVGAFLINAILPAQTPKLGSQDQQVSPTYSTSAQGNRARLFEPIPCQYGRHIMYPDWIVLPFASYKDNQQQIYQLLCAGVEYYEHEAVRLGEVEVWNSTVGYTGAVDGVEIAWIEPGQPVTLFPGLVFTSPLVGGQDLRKAVAEGDFTLTSTRATGTDGGGIDDESPNFNTFLVGDEIIVTGAGTNNGSYTITAKDSGTSHADWIEVTPNFPAPGSISDATFTVTGILGPFPCSPSGTKTYRIAFDVAWPRGLGEANDEGGIDNDSITWEYSYREIDDSGAPVGAGTWTVVPRDRDSGTSQPLRLTDEYDVPLARYEARVQRTSALHTDTKHLDQLQWIGLRGFVPDDNIYQGVTLLAVKFNVGEQITQATTRQINVIQTRKLPWLSGGVWQPIAPTRSIAWAAADVLRNTGYGAGISDTFIDAAKLPALETTWLGRDDTFDGVFDTKQSIWEALSAVLRVGRAYPLLIGSTISFGRDEPQLLNTAVLTPLGMSVDNFSTEHIMYDENSPDDVIIEYMDEETWKPDEVQCKLAGSVSVNPARVKLFGSVKRTNSWQYGMYQAASNAYRRVVGNIKTEMQGRLLLRGKAVLVSHDLPSWGQSAQLVEQISTNELLLDRPLDWSSLEQHHMAFRRPGGGDWGPVKISQGATADVVLVNNADRLLVEVVQGAMAPELITEGDDRGREPTHIMMGAGETAYARRFLVSTTKPSGLESVDVVVQNYDERVYTAELDGTVPDRTTPTGPGQIPSKPQLVGLAVSQNPNASGNTVALAASWLPAPGALSYILQISYDNVAWSTVYSGSQSEAQFTVNAGVVFIRAAAQGVQRGDWALYSATFGDPTSTPGSLSGVAASSNGDESITVDYGFAARATTYLVQIWSETIFGSGNFNILEMSKEVAQLSATFGVSEVTAAGGPWNRYLAAVRGVNDVGQGPAATDTVARGLPAAPVINPATPLYSTDTSVLVQGTATPLIQVQLFDNGTLKTAVTTSFGGAWASVLTLTSGAPVHSITAKAVNSVGSSVASNARAVGVNYPGVPVVNAPGSTYNHTPTITGTSVALATVAVLVDGVQNGATVTADGAGNWSKVLSTQTDGAKSITATQTVSTVTGLASAAQTLTVSTPAAPSVNAPGSTYDHTPVITGTSLAAATIAVLVGGVQNGATVTADGSGNWTKTLSAQTDGAKSITATQTVSGSTSPASSAQTLTVLALDTDAAAWIAACTVEPTSTRMGIVNALIIGMKADGTWTKADRVHLHAAHDEQAGRLCLKTRSLLVSTTANSTSPIFTADRGWQGGGAGTTVGGYLASTFNSVVGTNKFLQDDAMMAVYVHLASSGAVANTYRELGGGQSLIATKNPTAVVTCQTNGTGLDAVANSGDGTGFYGWSRQASGTFHAYQDVNDLGATSRASAALASGSWNVLRAGSGYSNARVSATVWGGGLTAAEMLTLRNRLHTYLVAVGAAV